MLCFCFVLFIFFSSAGCKSRTVAVVATAGGEEGVIGLVYMPGSLKADDGAQILISMCVMAINLVTHPSSCSDIFRTPRVGAFSKQFRCIVIPEHNLGNGEVFAKLVEQLSQRDGTAIQTPMAAVPISCAEDGRVANLPEIHVVVNYIMGVFIRPMAP